MGGQVLGGGVIVLVVVALWLVYLVPTWQRHSRFHASERNAVRLNQALRVLAETSETPAELHVELSTRAAYEQQKAAKRLQAERERAQREHERLEREIERERQRVQLVQTQARVAAERAARQAAEAPVRQARARRAVRIVALAVLVVGLAATGAGLWWSSIGGPALVAVGGVVALALGVVMLERMRAVAARSRARAGLLVRADSAATVVVARAPEQAVQDVHLESSASPRWSPRPLPQALVSAPGSRAAAELDAIAARAAVARAAQEEAQRARIAAVAASAPPTIAAARAARAENDRPAAASRFASMGYVDNAEIEAHVRDLLARRASGQ